MKHTESEAEREARRAKERAYRKQHYLKNRERLRAQDKAYIDAHPEQRAASLKRYQEKHRERIKMLNREQARRTRIGVEPTRPCPEFCERCGKTNGKRALHMDHCHLTGIFRGWLCSKCNHGIGLLGDTIAGLRSAIEYLERAYGKRG